ncbi:sensor histidine kinase [Hydrogenophaga sp.]|uniref:sensor histidine kinase n=1 Tax=Hydrogenophaga sp. TaxID=1904254 RepID=UPI0035AE67A5
MTHNPSPWWLRWLPADSRASVQRRALVVWGVAAVIALVQHGLKPAEHELLPSFVYSYAISTSIWFLSDPMRIVLRRWLQVQAPYYWRFSPATMAYLVLAILLGYALGTAVGDAYTARSTWALLMLSPERFWGFLVWSLAVSGAFLFYFYHREKAHALEQLATETRLKLLESQLEPHMLFNTLANLRALIATDPPRAIDMLDRLNAYLRATLAASRADAQAHTLAREFERLDDYLALMAVRMGPRLRYRLNLPPELAAHPLPPLLLQPLVENAIRHGLEPAVAGGEIEVEAAQEGGALRLTVRDSGVGHDGPPQAGFGLTQVRERLQTAYGNAAQLDWRSAAGHGSQATLTLPLQTPATPRP